MINDTDSEHEHPVEDDNNDTLNLIEELCFTKWDWHNVFDILYDL